MTIIAYKEGILAADTQAVAGGTIEGQARKIARNEKGDLAGVSGEALYGDTFLKWFENGETGLPPEATKQGDATSSSRALIVRRNGQMEIYEHKGYSLNEPGYFALGSGRDHALGAMFVGATAIQAVEAAIAHDTYCGGKIVSLRHEP